MYHTFLEMARGLNEAFGVEPLLYGSLGLERRLGRALQADDIDVLVPRRLVTGGGWPALTAHMEARGYALIDLHEHTFQRGDMRIAFAALEELEGFAEVDIASIPRERAEGASYRLLTLEDYLRVYTASARDGYRIDHKHKQDHEKICLIRERLDAPR